MILIRMTLWPLDLENFTKYASFPHLFGYECLQDLLEIDIYVCTCDTSVIDWDKLQIKFDLLHNFSYF